MIIQLTNEKPFREKLALEKLHLVGRGIIISENLLLALYIRKKSMLDNVTTIEELRQIAHRRVPTMFYDYMESGSCT